RGRPTRTPRWPPAPPPVRPRCGSGSSPPRPTGRRGGPPGCSPRPPWSSWRPGRCSPGPSPPPSEPLAVAAPGASPGARAEAWCGHPRSGCIFTTSSSSTTCSSHGPQPGASMDALDLARWQFGITTVYHFLSVPITVALSLLVAILQTAWMRTRNPMWLRLTKFYGKLFTINFALGLVTGIVQEFQFGMNWSEYSRFVGDIFGAPLAVEALLAFFLESTFLGLWIFGWGRIPEKLHAA